MPDLKTIYVSKKFTKIHLYSVVTNSMLKNANNKHMQLGGNVKFRKIANIFDHNYMQLRL